MARIAKEAFAPACPIPKPGALKLGFKQGRYLITDIGLERYCGKCEEYWPADTEFFFHAPQTASGLHCYCKACYATWKATPNKLAA